MESGCAPVYLAETQPNFIGTEGNSTMRVRETRPGGVGVRESLPITNICQFDNWLSHHPGNRIMDPTYRSELYIALAIYGHGTHGRTQYEVVA